MSLKTQAKVLRVLQEQELERLGSNRIIKVDVRVIAATNKNLEEEIDKGTFREDLFYRLNVVPIHVPPLRERRDDIAGAGAPLRRPVLRATTTSGARRSPPRRWSGCGSTTGAATSASCATSSSA